MKLFKTISCFKVKTIEKKNKKISVTAHLMAILTAYCNDSGVIKRLKKKDGSAKIRGSFEIRGV